jgi:integrase
VSLTDADARNAKPRDVDYSLQDRHGLSLFVTTHGAKLWRFRYWFNGKQDRITIGHYPALGLAAARVAAGKLRTRLDLGENPKTPAGASAVSSTGARLDDVVAQYIANGRNEWKSSTARQYVSAIGTFTDWSRATGIVSVDQVDAAALARFRAHVIAAPRRIKKRGGKRTDVAASPARKSAAGVNCLLRAVASMLQVLRKSGLMLLSSDAIKDNLAPLPIKQVRPDSLKPPELRALLVACRKHDDEWTQSIAPLVIVMLLTGVRLGEALRLTWTDVDLDELTLRVVAENKTGRERLLDLHVSPALVRLLKSMHRRRTGALVFDHTERTAMSARLRLIHEHEAPPFLWSTRHSRPGSRSVPTLRSTCESYLANAPKILIFGAHSARRVADQIGHSVQVAERNYLGAMRRIPTHAKTLEDAMEIVDDLNHNATGRPSSAKPTRRRDSE